jgi:hypothetical protein
VKGNEVILEFLSKTLKHTADDARRECSSRGPGRRGVVQFGLDDFGNPGDFGLALVGIVVRTLWRAPPLMGGIVGALGGIGLPLAGSLMQGRT